MTTVGYGDIYPKTTLGRIVGIVIALWGLFLVSIFTVTLSNLFTFTAGEKKAYDLGQRLTLKDELKVSAANVLGSSYKSRKAKKIFADDKEAIKNYENEYKRNAINFFQISKAVKDSSKGGADATDHLRKEINDLMRKIMDMEKEQEQINDIFKHIQPPQQ
jgi:Ion channel